MTKLMYGFAFLFLFGCDNSSPEAVSSVTKDSTQKPRNYFPVADFIKSEIALVDSLPVGIMKYTTQNNILDSVYIKSEEFHQLAGEFLPEMLNREAFEKNFSESSFFDNTTHYSSFMYTSKNKNSQLRRVDVLVQAQDVVYDKVKSIYMEKVVDRSDSSITQKMFWKAGQNFQINSEIYTANKEASRKQVKVVWNPSE